MNPGIAGGGVESRDSRGVGKYVKIAVFQQRNGLSIRNLQQRKINTYRRCEICFYLGKKMLQTVFACPVTYAVLYPFAR